MDVSPSGGGIVKVDETIPSSHPNSYIFKSGTSVRLEAVPADGYVFNNWSKDLSGTANPTTVVMNCNKNITANFSHIVHTLNMQLIGNGSTTPSVGTHDHAERTVVTITATPDSGWQFDSWSGGVTNPSSATTTLTMDSDKTVAANFSQTETTDVRWFLVSGSIAGLLLVGAVIIGLTVRRRAA